MKRGPRIDVYAKVTLWARRLAPHYVIILVVAAALTIASVMITKRLRFNSDLADLLPDDHPDLVALRRVQAQYETDTGFMVLLSRNYLFAADRSGTLHIHDGKHWKRTPTGEPVHALWGFGPDQVFAAGDGGKVWLFDGVRWRPMVTGTRANLRGLWGDSPRRLFAVGDNGTIIGFDGKTWAPQPTPTRRSLTAISGEGGDLYAVGQAGTILHHDGERWSIERTGTSQDLLGVWAGGRRQAVAVGERGTFLWRRSGVWASVATNPSRETLRAVWGSRLGNVQAVGDRGTVLHFDGKQIRHQRSATTADLAAIHGTQHNDVWSAGGDCAVIRYDWEWYPGPYDSAEERQDLGLISRWRHGGTKRCTAQLSAIWRPKADLSQAKVLGVRLAKTISKSPRVSRVDLKKPVQFFWDRALLFSNVEDLEQLRDLIEENLERETAKGTGLYVDLEEDRGKESRQSLLQLYRRYQRQAFAFGSSEWYLHPDAASLGLVVYPTKGVSDFENLRHLRRELEQIIASTGYKALDPMLRVDVSGDAVAKLTEYDATVHDVFGKAWLAVVGIVLLMLIYFRRLVGLFFVALPLGMSISWTFAITTLFIGTLNAVTGFLFAVLFGLGIDYGLQLYARYREGRRAGLSPEDAMNHVILDTGRATLTSALTTSAALLTLTVTDFKGFSEFGFIAGVGVLLALISFIIVMPAMIFLAERLRLLRLPVARTSAKVEQFAPGQEPFRLPRTVLVLSIVVLGLGIYGSTRVRFEYDNRKLRAMPPRDEVQRRCQRAFGRSFTPTLLVTKNEDELRAAVNAIRRESDRRGRRSAVKNVISILDLVPSRQHEKKVILDDLKRLLHDKRWELVPEESKKKVRLARLRTMSREGPFDLADLPAEVRRAFKGPGYGDSWLAMVFHRIDLGHTKQARLLKEQVGSFEGSPWVNLGAILPEGAKILADVHRAEISCPEGTYQRCIRTTLERLRGLRYRGEPVFDRVLSRQDAYREKLATAGGLRGDILALSRPTFLLRSGGTRGGAAIQRSGEFHAASGELILAEVVEVLLHDGRLAFLLALGAIFLAALIDFRNLKSAMLACLPLAVGLMWTFGVMSMIELKLNLFNFVILPALLGIGIDYGVHYVHRYNSEGAGQLGRVMRSLYWVIFFCAATTIVGFGNMALASHPGLESLGQLAIIGLACMFFASTYTLPAMIFVLERISGLKEAALPATSQAVVVYATSFCPSCRLVRRFLTDHGVTFSYVELDTLTLEDRRRVAAEVIAATGADILPVTRFHDRFVAGFKPADLLGAISRLEEGPDGHGDLQ